MALWAKCSWYLRNYGPHLYPIYGIMGHKVLNQNDTSPSKTRLSYPPPELKICGSELDIVNQTKYRCVHVDSSLDLKEYIKVSRALLSIHQSIENIGFLKHEKNILPIASLKTFYLYVLEPFLFILASRYFYRLQISVTNNCFTSRPLQNQNA